MISFLEATIVTLRLAELLVSEWAHLRKERMCFLCGNTALALVKSHECRRSLILKELNWPGGSLKLPIVLLILGIGSAIIGPCLELNYRSHLTLTWLS